MKKIALMFMATVMLTACGGGDNKSGDSGSNSSNTIKMESATISGDEADYLSFTGEDATMSVVPGPNLHDGNEWYAILVKVPVKVEKSAEISTVYYPVLDIIDENGAPLLNNEFELGYKERDDEGKEELKRLLKQAPGTTGTLTFYSSKNIFDKESADKKIKNLSNESKTLRIKNMHFIVKEVDEENQ